jgi:AcrR family transcriptional regulator
MDGHRRKEYKNNRRPQVMAAAMRLFTHYGFDGTSHDMIAKESGVTKSAIGRLFGTKEQLAARCIQDFMTQFGVQVQQRGASARNYEEQTVVTSQIMREHRAEWRFILSLMLTPAHEKLAQYLWDEDYTEKLVVLDRYREELGEVFFAELPFLIMSTHITYVVGGNEERYEGSRKALLRQFLGQKPDGEDG